MVKKMQLDSIFLDLEEEKTMGDHNEDSNKQPNSCRRNNEADFDNNNNNNNNNNETIIDDDGTHSIRTQ